MGGKMVIQWDFQIYVKQIAKLFRMVQACSCACIS